MHVIELDHINIHTNDMEALTRFYENVLGLKRGWRPPFSSVGMWIYRGEQPLVHVREVEGIARQERPQVNHFAFRAEGLTEFLQRLEEAGAPHEVRIVPESGQTQVFLADPDGNSIEMQFSTEETKAWETQGRETKAAETEA